MDFLQMLHHLLEGGLEDIPVAPDGINEVEIKEDMIVKYGTKTFLKLPHKYSLIVKIATQLNNPKSTSVSNAALNFVLDRTIGKPKTATANPVEFDADKIELLTIPPAVCPNCGYEHKEEDTAHIPNDLKQFFNESPVDYKDEID